MKKVRLNQVRLNPLPYTSIYSLSFGICREMTTGVSAHSMLPHSPNTRPQRIVFRLCDLDFHPGPQRIVRIA